MPLTSTRWLLAPLLALALVGLFAPTVLAGGGPENVLLIVDPSSQESLHVANHYRSARGIPEQNVVYMAPGNEDFERFAAFQVPALYGALRSRRIEDHIDYVVVAPGNTFYVPAAGLVDNVTGGSEEAAPRRFSISSAYTLAPIADRILEGAYRASSRNQFYGTRNAAVAFDAGASYNAGEPSTSPTAERYFIGFLLGYTGERGNSVQDLIAMIDRSVEADGRMPDGTFYYMETDDIRSIPRDPHFAAATAAISAAGGSAEVIYKVDDVVQLLPRGRHDVLGVMTGHAAPGVVQADMTLLPGSYGDHLTSFAATFDVGGQEKLSRWVAKGASGSMGTVEEPYVYGEGITGKFPHPRLFVWYRQGMSLGESLFRSHQWLPFQGLFYGDPITRPFAQPPVVDIPDFPTGPVSGTVAIRPEALTSGIDRRVASYELLIDGERHGGAAPGTALEIYTDRLPDGAHDVRVLAYDDSPTRDQGRWVGTLVVDNAGRQVALHAEPLRGDLATSFAVEVAAVGAISPYEVQLLHAGRVVAAARGDSARFAIPAHLLGAGISELRAVALYEDGRPATSLPVALAIRDEGAPTQQPGAPAVHGYTAFLWGDEARLVDLPAIGSGPITRQVVRAPERASLRSHAGAFLLDPEPGANGPDALSFVATTNGVTSTEATIELFYCAPLQVRRPPSSVEACLGDAVTLSVDASGAQLGYRWYRDDRPIAGTTGPELEIASLAAGDLGAYTVVVTSWCGNRRAEADTTAAARVTLAPSDRCRPRALLPWAGAGG